MSTQEGLANIGKVLTLLRDWDRGDRKVRGCMLDTFLTRNTGKTFFELEMEFAQVASLFLARLTTWMRLTYMFGTCLGQQLKAIGVFLSASGHDQYLVEFLQDGGVLTLLDVLGHSQTKEEEKLEALQLLLTVSDAGRNYKEIICESWGAKDRAECLAKLYGDETQETALALLESLCHGNPKHQEQIYTSLVALMTLRPPNDQQLFLHTFHKVQSKMKTAHHSIVDPLLRMLRSLRLEVQNEAIHLIVELKGYDDVRPSLLSGLVALLRPTWEVQQDQTLQVSSESEKIKMTGSLPVFVQQAAAAKAIRLLAEGSPEVSRELLSLEVIRHILYAMGNREHTDAQVQASLALEHFVRSHPLIEEQVQSSMGSALFAAFLHRADTLYMHMDETQAELLLTNKVGITEVLDGENYGEH